jgi:hypothetical protein
VLALAAVLVALPETRSEAAVPANGRAWELVTVNPASSSRVVGARPIRHDGDRLIYGAAGPPKDSPMGAGINYGTAVRGPSGWTDVPFGLSYQGKFAEPVFAAVPMLATAFAADDETVLWVSALPLAPGAPPEETLGLYRQLPGAAPELIAQLTDEPALPLFFFNFTDLSSDGSRAVFVSARHYLPSDAGRTQGTSVYAWDGGTLEQVDVDNGGTLLSTCGSWVPKENGMSVDGNRVFVTVLPECGNLEKVYLRDIEAGTTTEISASLCARVDCNAPANVKFVGATPDGKFAYLTTTQQLLDADEDPNRDLYRYDVDAGELILLSTAPGVVEVNDQRVFPSDAGERVYFKALQEVGPGEVLPRFFMADGNGTTLVAEASVGGWFGTPEVGLSKDGSKAVFIAEDQVLEGDTDSQPDAYLYDAVADSLTRISTGPAGGNGEQGVRIEPVAPVNRHEFEFGNTRPYYAIDTTGDRVFFQTNESLVAEDANGVADVYEWWGGEARLITPGQQPLSSEFAGASRDGRTVIFATNASLVGRDADGQSRDLYAARLGGGFAEPPPPPPGCDNATCPLPSSERIGRSTPPSMGAPQGKGKGKSAALSVVSVAPKAKNGAVSVVVSAPAPGPVSGQLWTRKKGKKVILATGSARAKRAGQVELKLKLTRSARRSAGSGAKSAELTVKQGSARTSQTVKVSLG